ncbi:hypothetical protein JCM30760_20590 [Thiomicrorhabdus hydrogeniphila]
MKNNSPQPLLQKQSAEQQINQTSSIAWYKWVLILFSVGLMFIIYSKTLNPLINGSDNVSKDIYFLNVLQDDIMQTVTLGKSQEIKEFDTLNQQTAQLKSTLNQLANTLAVQNTPKLKESLAVIITKANQQDSYIESFKTTHAVKQISINFLPTAFAECFDNINQPSSEDANSKIKLIQKSLINALKFKKQSNQETSFDLKQINHQIITSGHEKSCINFLHHNSLLTDALSKEESIYLQLKTLDLSQDLQTFYIDFMQQRDRLKSNNNMYYFILLALTLWLLIFVILSFKRQFTENKKLSLSVQNMSQQQGLFTTLIKLNRAIADIHEKQPLFQAVCDITHTEAKFDSCWIGLIDETETVIPISSAGDDLDIITSFKVSLTDGQNNGTIAKAYKTQAPVITNDFKTWLLNTNWANLASSWKIKGSATLPILLNGKVIGFFITYSKKRNFFTKEINILLEQLAYDLGLVLGKLQLEKEQKQHQQDLAISAIAFESYEAIIITDANNRIIRANRAFTRLTGYSQEETIGQTPNILKSGLHDNAFYQKIWSNINKKGKWQGEIWNRKKDGTLYPTWQSISALFNNEHEVTHYVGHAIDLTKDKESQQEIHYLNNHDNLTQLPNRNLLIDRLEQQLNQYHPNYSFLFLININRFKLFNESLGHSAGDDLLIQVSKRLEKIHFENIFNKTVSRIGNDEFAVLYLSDIDTLEEASVEAGNIANQLHNKLSQNFVIQSKNVIIDTCIGVTLFTPNKQNKNSKTPETLLQEANTALQRAKKETLVAVQFFEKSMQSQAQKRLNLETDLRSALHNNEFILHFQPQYSLKTKCIIGLESLIRWNHKEQGIIPPNDFIPILEETGLINQVGTWVIETSIAQAQILHKIDPNLTMSVNLSAVQFNDKNLVDNVKNILKTTNYPANKLEFEVTESLLMSDIKDTIYKLNQLAEEGIKIAIDDFGTGYSSLAYLKQFPVNRLKIDKSFINDISDPNDADSAIVRATIQMAHALHINTIAEGVEETCQLELLKSFNCDEVQGYLCSKPLPSDDLLIFINQRLNQLSCKD